MKRRTRASSTLAVPATTRTAMTTKTTSSATLAALVTTRAMMVTMRSRSKTLDTSDFFLLALSLSYCTRTTPATAHFDLHLFGVYRSFGWGVSTGRGLHFMATHRLGSFKGVLLSPGNPYRRRLGMLMTLHGVGKWKGSMFGFGLLYFLSTLLFHYLSFLHMF